MDGAKQSDWWKLTKFVEFAYRRMYIPGTNLTPFMVARARQPTVPSELERLQTGGTCVFLLESGVRCLARGIQKSADAYRP